MSGKGSSPNRVVFRDLLIFQVKLALDGIKDVVLAPASIIAALIDMVLPGAEPGRLFYRVMRVGERYDRWLSLYSASMHAAPGRDGLFGASRAGSDTLLGEIEAMVLGHEEPRAGRGRR